MQRSIDGPSRARGRTAAEAALARDGRDPAYREARAEYAALRELRRRHPLAAHVRERRYELGMTRQQVADAAGTSHAFVARIEDGHLPGLPALQRVLAALAEDVELTIVERGDDEQPQRSTIRLRGTTAS